MKRVRKGRLPGSERIVEQTFEELGYAEGGVSPEDVQRNFNKFLFEVWRSTLEVLERYEKTVYGENIPDELVRLHPSDLHEAESIAASRGIPSAFKLLFQKWYPYLVEIFLSISQSRKQRGGKDFELQFAKLLSLMRVPYERIDRKYRVDFIMPNAEAFEKNKTTAMIASAKRTLRERWREVVEELHNTRAPNIFLITADFDISSNHVKSICGQYNIHLVVWDEVKNKNFRDEPLVLGYTQWANERVPALRQFWKT